MKSEEPLHLVIVGLGYVGLPMAVRAAQEGIRVTGLDLSQTLVDSVNAGRSHIGDVSDRMLGEALTNGLQATTDPVCIAEADAVIVCVPTPLADDGGPDLGAVRSAAWQIGQFVRPGTLVVLESTTYPGTTEEIFAPLVATKVPLEDLDIAFSPERVNPGDPFFGVKNTPKVVGGLTPRAADRAVAMYSRFIDRIVRTKGAAEAELAKLIENTFRHVNIALVNEMARLSHDLGIDLWDAIAAAETKPFGFMAFRPGPGVGGHCIPVDPAYLNYRVRARLGHSFRMVELAEEINHSAPMYVVARVQELLNLVGTPTIDARVLLLGVTYKPDVADLRETPAEPLADRLVELGCSVSYHDPFVPVWQRRTPGEWTTMTSVEDEYAAACEADVTILVTNHHSYDLKRLVGAAQLLFDTRGVIPPGDNVVRL